MPNSLFTCLTAKADKNRFFVYNSSAKDPHPKF
jgi:hypothetical protein